MASGSSWDFQNMRMEPVQLRNHIVVSGTPCKQFSDLQGSTQKLYTEVVHNGTGESGKALKELQECFAAGPLDKRPLFQALENVPHCDRFRVHVTCPCSLKPMLHFCLQRSVQCSAVHAHVFVSLSLLVDWAATYSICCCQRTRFTLS